MHDAPDQTRPDQTYGVPVIFISTIKNGAELAASLFALVTTTTTTADATADANHYYYYYN